MAKFPKFKSRKKTTPSFYQDNVKIQFSDTHVKVEGFATSKKKNKQKLNWIRLAEHNRIPTTDGRLIRRIVRDARTRGTSAKETIRMWPSVRKGEECNIFPYQEEADVMFNSALIYELAVLKPYVEAQLFGIERECPEYLEAKRLLKFLDYFVGIGSENVPANSLLREFIGGGCFHV